MGEIATSIRQITLFYNSKSTIVKQVLAYAKAEGLAIAEIDTSKTTLTGTQIGELAKKLKVQIKDLVDQEHPLYISKYGHPDFSERDWIKMIQHHPEIMKLPIALHNNRTKFIKIPTDIINI